MSGWLMLSDWGDEACNKAPRPVLRGRRMGDVGVGEGKVSIGDRGPSCGVWPSPGRKLGVWWVASVRRRRRRQVYVRQPAVRQTERMMPTAIPALAAVFSPPPPWVTGVRPETDGVTRTSTHAGPDPAKVQDCVTPQHPPPMLLGQAIWAVVQPGGNWDTKVALVADVLVQRHWELLAQVWP